MQPVKIKLLDNSFLLIKWDDNSESKIGLQKMRKLCPCASCFTNRENQSKSYIPLLLTNQFAVAGMEVIGSYAIQISWKDGHDTGIYEYRLLKNLASG
jgi:DUF971 family protein